jgi:hypothetical protein
LITILGWITGMDLASQSGQIITTSEDGFVKVRKNQPHKKPKNRNKPH